jgi:hypothetical protein
MMHYTTLQKYFFIFACLMVIACNKAYGAGKVDKVLLERVMDYPESFYGIIPDTIRTNVYMKARINLDRRNPLLMAIPSLFYVARDGRRDYFTEAYYHATFTHHGTDNIKRNITLSTVYHNHNVLSNIMDYMKPEIYRQTINHGEILSPLSRANRKYYTYSSNDLGNGIARLSFHSKIRNTQLIRNGFAHVDYNTGRVISFLMEGEYDMMHFVLEGVMHDKGVMSLFAKECRISSKLSIAGNRILTWFNVVYDLPHTLNKEYTTEEGRKIMEKLRPVPLSDTEQRIIHEYDSIRTADHAADMQEDSLDNDSTNSTRKIGKAMKYVLWDILGYNMVKRIGGNIGKDEKGQFRIGPIFNPLYFGYTRHKGIVYKLDIRGNYNFTNNSDITGRAKIGYSFKQRQLFFDFPLTYHFNKRRNGYVGMELANGNRITDARILDEIKEYHHNDSIDWDRMQLDYFRDMRCVISANYDVIRDRLGLRTGVVTHRRSAINPEGFSEMGRKAVYTTFAPFIEMKWRPFTDRVPLVLTANYECGTKVMGGDVRYHRFEFDGQAIYRLPALRSISLRAGLGLYADKGGDDYFLDYHNFHENYIPDGWGDDWTGEFELLNSNYYNSSKYYVRSNATYESPLMLLSWVPCIGQIVERERIYVSALAVKMLYPYIEAGYGFTNRAFSMGIFTGFSPKYFEGVGIKFGFELFNNW